MALRTPTANGLPVQPTNPAALGSHSYWGTYPTTAQLPNASGNQMPLPVFSLLQAGDLAHVAGQNGIFVCTNPGTVAPAPPGTSATWRRQRRFVSHVWNNLGALDPLAVSTAGALDGLGLAAIGGAAAAGFFDGFREVVDAASILSGAGPAAMRLRQRVGGAGDPLTVELYRLRAGIWTLIGSVSIPGGSGDGATATAAVTDASAQGDDCYVALVVVVPPAALPVGVEDVTFTLWMA